MPPRDRTRIRSTLDWDRVNRLFMESIDRVAPAMDRLAPSIAQLNSALIEPLAPWEVELLGASTEPADSTIESANTEGEEAVPPRTRTVTIEPSASIRRIAFERNDYARVLMQTTDEEVWNRTLQEFRQASQPFDHIIEVGSYDIGTPGVNIPNYGLVNQDYVTIDQANELIEAASDGRVLFAQVNPTDDSRYRLAPITALEDEAWKRYNDGAISVSIDYDETVDGHYVRRIPLRYLRQHMTSYANFRSAARREYIRQVLQDRMITQSVQDVPADQQGFTVERVRRFSRFINKIKDQLVVVPHPFRFMDLLPHGTLASRRWGIEVESPFIDGVHTPKGWLLKPDGSLRGLQEANHAPYLDHGDECAFFSETQQCDCGLGNEDQAAREFNDSSYPTLHNPTEVGEWNSPVLRSYHSRGLEYLCSQLENRKVNDTASCHVHVQAKDLTPAQIVRLALIFSALEALWVAEYHRASRKYCKPLDTDLLIDRFRLAKSAEGNVNYMQHSGKYFAVNFNSLSQHGTVEFRTMGPRYNYKHLIRWASFCREMVNIAKADVPQREWAKVRTFQDLLVLFSKYGKETATPPWAKKVASKNPVEFLGKELRRLPNPARQADGVTDQHDDYYTKEPLVAFATPRW